jgi:8-amino-7-oxononanoate synthase
MGPIEGKIRMFSDRYRRKLALQKESGLFRDPPPIDRREGKHIVCRGRRLLNMASNDYLGLGAGPELRRKVADNFVRYGSSSSSSRLVSGNFTLLNEAEAAYARYFGYEAALFYPSGYQANLGVLSTLFEPGDTLLFDKHIHASSVKGLALSGAQAKGFNHSAMDHLEKRLKKSGSQVGVVTESLFSMDGDRLDVSGLKSLKEAHHFFCIVDEAHAFGTLGPQGRGLAREVADVAVGTYGKALGLFGAFVCTSAEIKSYLLNFSSPQIYTTTLPEAHAASTLDVLEAVSQSGPQRRHLVQLSGWLKAELRGAGFRVSGDAHILAVEIGREQSAVDLAQSLLAKGIFVLPARYPTVPLNRAILRISLTALHTEADGDILVKALKESYESNT